MAEAERTFRAVLEKGDRALGWTIAHVPFDPAAVWPERVRQRVRGTVNGFAFRSSLFPVAGDPGRFYLLVNRAMQTGGHVGLGGTAEFMLAPDLEARAAGLPEELDALLDEAEGLRAWYGELTEYMRRELGKWIAGVKSDEARVRRAEQVAERMMLTMEAERELPSLIRRAFLSRPKAAAGWPRLTERQRRQELMAVFYYQSPESREKRLAKMCDLAEKQAR